MSDFTPGPWFCSQQLEDELGCIFVSVGAYELEPPKDQHYEDTICEVWGNEHDAVANARLIAAAPDLLAALAKIPFPSTMGTAAQHYQHFYDWYRKHAEPAIRKASP